MTEAELDAMTDEEFATYMDSPDEIEDETAGDDSGNTDEGETTPDDDVDAPEDTSEEEEESNNSDDNSEDTDQSEDEDETDETTTEGDGSEEGTSEETENKDEENSPEDANSDDKTDDEKGETDSKEDGSEDGKTEISAEEYAKYKAFYDEVTGAEFVANGRKMKGFTDPKKLIVSQQLSANYSEKMAAFKKYKPFIDPLQRKGLLEDPEKFDLMMNIVDGDKEALKKFIKDSGIDPIVDLDIEAGINYEGKSQRAGELDIAYSEVLDTAQNYGVKDQVARVLGEQWDDDSVISLLKDPTAKANLVEHIHNGAFDAVQDRIAEKKRLDVTGAFAGMTDLQRYNVAVRELEAEFQAYSENKHKEAEAVEANKAKIEQERKEAAYKAQAEKREKEIANQRKKATQVSKKKTVAKKKAKAFDPMDLDDDGFEEYMNALMYEK